MSTNDKTIYVYADWQNDLPALVGLLYITQGRGKEIISFQYNDNWLKMHAHGFLFDPELKLYEGRQYVTQGKQLFGVFSDSCPDRWGRLLMNRKETIIARNQGRKPRALSESDYLLGVFDKSRLGALRFALEENGPFLSKDEDLSTPPWTSLRSLESAAISIDNVEYDKEDSFLKLLLAPGSSLGGARPKASVQAPDGSLWIAKFPSKYDEWDIGAWEAVVHDLAALCEINVPEAKLIKFSDIGSTFLVKRFDRAGHRRIHFSSAMALLGKTDGIGAEDTGYLDIAYFIKSNSASSMQCLKELWKRIVFNMLVSNTDDHLRNHGFLLTRQGWRLSPQFDVNPNIYGNTLSLNVSPEDNTIDLKLAEETALYYDISSSDAKSIINKIQRTVADKWRVSAKKYGLNKNAIDRMEPAFYV